jgi:hypothetical protein
MSTTITALCAGLIASRFRLRLDNDLSG